MARYIQRPENALKRANEFIDVGKPARALDTLQEVFRNKKWTYNWSESVIEPIMFKYLDLCVELRKSHIAKEGLFQYRNMFQLVNVGSLENVIRGYLRMAEERTEMAQQQSSQAVLDIDDLDNLETPESILMSAVCGEDAQDRSDRTILLPWVKFLWESYCQCLELLRVNTHCEVLYHDIARMTFQFCLKYNRKMEFRKLCEKLRKHLEDICKTTPQTANVSITKPETQQLNLDTRLHQLDSAIQMEAWQEAYKAIEDIHGLMTLSKKTPVAKTMANYYQKLAMVFWKAGNQLFHAAALLKLFQLTREMKKNITPEELQRMASHVLVATLAIPLPSAHPEFDRFIETDKSPLEKAQRLAVLLGLTQTPTRASLLKEIIRVNVVQLASEKFCNLYQWLEIDFDPLNLCGKVQSAIDFIEDDPNSLLKQYSQSLKDVTLVRLVRQICQVYQSIEFSRLLVLAKFADIFYLERILVDCVRHNDMQIRIDHKKQSIHFGTDLTESQREDHPDGPTLQSMPSEQVRSQLVNMSVVLNQAITTINPNHKKADREKLRNRMVQYYHDNKAKEHHQVLQRQKIIEERKEHIERLNNEREEEEMRRLEEINRLQKIAEQKRLEAELEERERKRHENEILQIKEKSLKEKMQQISQTAHGQKVLKKLDEEEIRKLDAEQIAAREAEELIKERKELQSKLKSQEKKIDYYERAKRIEEIPLIDAYLQEKQVLDKQFWETQEQQRIENSISERKNAVSQQERLKRMHVDRDTFLNNLKAERNSMYIEKLKAFNTYLEEEKKKRIAQRIIDRREERRAKWLREKEEERLRQEEELRRLKEEEERIERERLNKLHEIEMEKLRAQAEKQRIKNEEAERKIQAEREAILKQVEKERETWPKEKDEMSNWRTQKTGGGERERERDRDREQKSEPWRPKFREADNRGPGDRERGNEKWRHGGERDQEGRENRDNREVRDRKPMDRDRPIRRGGDEKREDRRVDTGRPIRRDDDRPERRGGERDFNRDRRDGPRRDDRDRRGGEDRERRGGDDRERRGGDDRREGFGRRQMDREQKSDGGNWRRGPARDGDGPRTGEGGNWRAERPARRTEEDKDQDGGEWTSVKRH